MTSSKALNRESVKIFNGLIKNTEVVDKPKEKINIIKDKEVKEKK